jgi:hypothetical protein
VAGTVTAQYIQKRDLRTLLLVGASQSNRGIAKNAWGRKLVLRSEARLVKNGPRGKMEEVGVKIGLVEEKKPGGPEDLLLQMYRVEKHGEESDGLHCRGVTLAFSGYVSALRGYQEVELVVNSRVFNI